YNERRPYGTLRNAIHPTSSFAEVRRQASGEGPASTLRSCIVDQVWTSPIRRHRRGVHYGTASLHRRQRILGNPEHGEYVRREGFLQLVRSDIGDRLAFIVDRRVVHQDIDATQLFDGRLNNPFANRLRRNVATQQHALPAQLLDFLFRPLRVLMFVEIRQCYIGALFREEDGNGSTDTAIPACNERNLILQLEVTLRTFCLRPGFHFRLASRTLLGLRWMYLFLLRHTGSRICQDVLALLFLLRNFRALLTGL